MNRSIKNIINQHKVTSLRPLRRYAIFIPLINIQGVDHLLYQVRSQSIGHPGQTSFPGGAIEAGETPQQAAVRETIEELGLPPESIEVYGELDYMVDLSRIIYCFVGRLHLDDLSQLALNPAEVDHVFTLPLEELTGMVPEFHPIYLDTRVDDNFPYDLVLNERPFKSDQTGYEVPFYRLTHESLWGITAHFTSHFIQILTEQNYFDAD